MTAVEFTIPGLPQSQGSMRAFVVKGRAHLTSDNPGLRAWRADAQTIAADHCTLSASGSPVRIVAEFYMPRPAGHYGTGRNAGKVRDSAPERPTTKPDVDKLARALLDALTGIAYVDDSQVTDISAAKRWALAGPGTRVTVYS